MKLLDKDHLVQEKDRIITIIRDELSAHALELTHKEQRVSELEAENRVLVERWLKRSQEEAEKMNEVNAFMETALKLRVGEEGAGILGTPAGSSISTHTENRYRHVFLYHTIYLEY